MENNNKLLYIIAGANGSGKSTLSEVLLKEKDLEFLNADNIAREIAPDRMDKVPISAGKIYFKRLKSYFDEDMSFAVETTLSGNNIERIINIARSKNYKISLAYIYINKFITCIRRVKFRVLNGGHNVPEQDIIRRYYKSIINFWDKYRFLVDDWTLFHNDNDYKPISIADGTKEKCDIIDIEKYSDFIKLYNDIRNKN